MQHIGDLEPLGQPDFFADHAPLGRYSAKRSRWRFAVGKLEVGFDRASEQIQAQRGLKPVQQGSGRGDFGQRLMILVGMLSTATLSIALAGWLWSSRGAITGGSERVEMRIIDRNAGAPAGSHAAGSALPTVIPTPPAKARLTAIIERGSPAPAVAPAPRASIAIADGADIKPRPAETGKPSPAPDEAIIASGNFLLVPSIGIAVSQAMTSGEAQNWEAGTYRGLVVVGEADRREGKSCRQGTVLLRDGSNQGRTQRFERCV